MLGTLVVLRMGLASERDPVNMPLKVLGTLVTSTVGVEVQIMRAVVRRILKVVLVESLMRVITSVHAYAWLMAHQVDKIILVLMIALALSFHAATL